MGDVSVDSNFTTTTDTASDEDFSIPPIVSIIITVCFISVAVASLCVIYRFVCKSKPRHHDPSRVKKGDRKEFFDQFDVNCSQMNLEEEEKKFTNPAAKITSESESTSSNLSTTTPENNNGALSSLVKSIHGDARFTVSKIPNRSSRPSSLKIKVPKQFVASSNSSQDEQFALALIDKRSNTIHNIELNDCVVVDKPINSAGSAVSSVMFAQKWRNKTRQRRLRRCSTEFRQLSAEGRPRFLPRQTSCPHSMCAKNSLSESLSSNSEDSSPQEEVLQPAVSLSSIDETKQKLFDGAVFST